MNEEIEPLEQDQTPVKAPRLVCVEGDATKILEELGMAEISRRDSAPAIQRPPGLNDLLKLGAFVEGSGVVPLDHGAILITKHILIRQMLRLETVAQGLDTDALEEHKEMTYAMGYLGAQIGKIATIGIKTKVAAEVAAEELRKKRQPSWEHGAAVGTQTLVKAEAGSTVLVGGPNGVAQNPNP